jgi:hypothetical protein
MNYALLQRKIDTGIGKAALRLGQPFSAYRLGAASSGEFPAGWTQLGTLIPIYRERVPEPKLEVAIPKSAVYYNIFADMSPYNLGDVFLCTDPPFVPGVSYGENATILPDTFEINGLALAWHMPARIPIGVRLTHLARVYRPATSPKALTDGSGYWASAHDNDAPLVLKNGVYSFGAAGSGRGSLVPAGFATAYRPSGPYPFGPPVPGMIRPTHWYVYLPPLPGYTGREGDAIITVDDARYVVVDPYRQESGLVGQQMLVDRTASQEEPPADVLTTPDGRELATPRDGFVLGTGPAE